MFETIDGAASSSPEICSEPTVKAAAGTAAPSSLDVQTIVRDITGRQIHAVYFMLGIRLGDVDQVLVNQPKMMRRMTTEVSKQSSFIAALVIELQHATRNQSDIDWLEIESHCCRDFAIWMVTQFFEVIELPDAQQQDNWLIDYLLTRVQPTLYVVQAMDEAVERARF